MANNYIIKTSKKYPITLLSHITGLTEGTFSSGASNKGWTSKGGLTIEQAVEIVKTPRRNDTRSLWSLEQGREVIEGFKAFGVYVRDTDILNEFYGNESEGFLPLK